MRFPPVPLLLALGVLVSPAPPTSGSPETGELMRSENAFAADAATLGTRGAFLRWLAPSGVIFRPGPVNGIAAYQSRPANRSRLSWHPTYSETSAGDDIGWTTGPWEFRSDSTKLEADAYGHFVSVWRRQADGNWRVALDVGIGHAAPAPGEVQPLATRVEGVSGGRRPLAERNALWKADAEFAREAASAGVPAAIAKHAAPDVRVYRDGSSPFAGVSVARESLAAREGRAVMLSNAQFIGKAADLGYTYGTFVVAKNGGPDTSSYIHVWRRSPTRVWQLVMQLVTPWK